MPYSAPLGFDSGYIFLPVFGGPGTRMLRSILVLLFVPVYSALLGSTVDTDFASVYGEFRVFLRELVDYGS